MAGAGMAGLAAAARAKELGAEPLVLEKGDRAGGSMLLSSCVIWRYHSLEAFQAECPDGDSQLQRVIVEQLDEAIDWLESLGAPVVEHETGNPRTVGKRFDPPGLTQTLVHVIGDGSVRLSERGQTPLQKANILCTGGFPVRLARERGLLLRANPWSEGDGLDFALTRGGQTVGDLDEFYGRAMPAVEQVAEADFVRLAQLYGRHAVVTAHDMSERFEGEPDWSETALVQKIADWPDALAWYTVEPDALEVSIRDRTIGEMIEAAREAGGVVEEVEGRIAVLVRPGVTQTLGGIRIDERARVVGADGLYAAGADVGGISGGGWSSGLAAALVFGRIAAETALS
ncbi:MAG TPA: FAD-binding protein [Gaiellaceae bacterium]|nr:FAD-binding protein [Gaiellaceae bacterium]